MQDKTINGSVTNKASVFSFYAVCSFEQSLSENATYVSVTTYFKTKSTADKFDTVSARAASISVGNQTFSVSKRFNCNPWTSNPYMIQKVSRVKVAHNADGTASIKISAKADGTASSYGPSSSSSRPCTLSQTITLDRIDRGIVLVTAPNFTDLQNPAITYTNPIGAAVTSAKACISFDGTTDDISYRAIDINSDSYIFNLTSAERTVLRNKVTASARGNVKFIVKTVANGQTVVSELERTVTIEETDDTKPSLSFTVSPQNGTTIGSLFAQGLSKASVDVSATAKYGATVSAYAVVIDGKTYNTSTVISDTLTSAGTVTVLVKVTDSRGFSAQATQEITVLPYSLPSVVNGSGAGSVMCYRGNESGEEAADGTSIYIKAKRQYSPLVEGGANKNLCILRWRSRSTSASGFGSWNTLLSGAATTDEFAGVISGTFPVTDSFEIEIGVVDAVGGTQSVSFIIPEGSVTFHLKKGGKAIGVGRYADEDETFASAWKGIFDKGLFGTALFTKADDVLAFAESCIVGLTPFLTTTATTNLPSTGYYSFSPGIVFRCGSSWAVVYLFDYADGTIAVCNMVQNQWSKWRYIKSALPT